MSRKRMLNTDYYKLDAKQMRRTVIDDKKHGYTVIGIQTRRYPHK